MVTLIYSYIINFNIHGKTFKRVDVYIHHRLPYANPISTWKQTRLFKNKKDGEKYNIYNKLNIKLSRQNNT